MWGISADGVIGLIVGFGTWGLKELYVHLIKKGKVEAEKDYFKTKLEDNEEDIDNLSKKMDAFIQAVIEREISNAGKRDSNGTK